MWRSCGRGRGSSPRAWGTLPGTRFRYRSPRFIPTGVGNSPAAGTVSRKAAVHPHGRGELVALLVWICIRAGSSPRAWGTLSVRWPAHRRVRFIPTGVGNSPRRRAAKRPRAVHPHGRGELGDAHAAQRDWHGSSPRAWGTRRCHRTTLGCRRFIPTGVGNSGRAASR